jgi:hypothetical protein
MAKSRYRGVASIILRAERDSSINVKQKFRRWSIRAPNTDREFFQKLLFDFLSFDSCYALFSRICLFPRPFLLKIIYNFISATSFFEIYVEDLRDIAPVP